MSKFNELVKKSAKIKEDKGTLTGQPARFSGLWFEKDNQGRLYIAGNPNKELVGWANKRAYFDVETRKMYAWTKRQGADGRNVPFDVGVATEVCGGEAWTEETRQGQFGEDVITLRGKLALDPTRPQESMVSAFLRLQTDEEKEHRLAQRNQGEIKDEDVAKQVDAYVMYQEPIKALRGVTTTQAQPSRFAMAATAASHDAGEPAADSTDDEGTDLPF